MPKKKKKVTRKVAIKRDTKPKGVGNAKPKKKRLT